MKLKRKLTPFIFGFALVSSLFLATFAPSFQGTAAAAGYGDDAANCQFNYTTDGGDIDRSNCINSQLGDLTYSSTASGTTGSKNTKFENVSDDKHCIQTITVQNEGDTSGQLSGKYEKDNKTCVSFTAHTVQIGAAISNGGAGCEGSSAVSWFMCPIIDGMQSMVGGIYDKIIEPTLVTKPIDTYDPPDHSNSTLEAWKNFRLYGDIFLVIGILVIVFGESIGGGLIDAYTAKKILPRLLIAAVLINLSFYIVAVLVDIMNIVGKGMMTLITAPFGLTGDFKLNIGITGGITFTALLASAGVFLYTSFAAQAASWLLFVVLLPLALVLLAILATVLLRWALIIFLVIISPVAFALYCLPNTEKYFRQWWDMLFKTLLVFPIIASLFAMGKVAAYLLSTPHGTGTNPFGTATLGAVGDLLAIIALMVPLFLIPFAFKIAGGIIGSAFGVVDGFRARGHKFTEGTRQRVATQAGKNRIQARQSVYSGMQSTASKKWARRSGVGLALKGGSKIVGGYNIEAAASAARADTAKILNDQIATGKDDEIRGLTVNKNWAKQQGALVADGTGNMSNGFLRETSSGKRQFKSLGGQWVDEADVDAGRSRWGNDTFAQQTALSYEMRKAQDEGQLQSLGENYRNVAQGPGGWNMSDQQAGGAWIGAAFERQNEHLEFKHSDWKTGELNRDSSTQGTRMVNGQQTKVINSGMRGAGLVNEAYEKKGSYTMAQMGANTFEQLKQAHNSADLVINGRDENGNVTNYTQAQIDAARQQQDKIKAISETFVHDLSAGGEGVVGQAGDVPITAGTGGAAGARGRMVSTPGAGAVSERAYELAVLTGTIRQQPTNQNPAGSRQKTQNP